MQADRKNSVCCEHISGGSWLQGEVIRMFSQGQSLVMWFLHCLWLQCNCQQYGFSSQPPTWPFTGKSPYSVCSPSGQACCSAHREEPRTSLCSRHPQENNLPQTRDSLPKTMPQPMGKDPCANGNRHISSTVPPSFQLTCC